MKVIYQAVCSYSTKDLELVKRVVANPLLTILQVFVGLFYIISPILLYLVYEEWKLIYTKCVIIGILLCLVAQLMPTIGTYFHVLLVGKDKVLRQRIVIFFEDSFKIESTVKEREFKYNRIRKIREIKDGYLIIVALRYGVIIRKHEFIVGDPDTFMAFLKTKKKSK